MSFRNVFDNTSPSLLTTPSASKQFEGGELPKPSNKVESFVRVLGGDFSQKLQIPNEFTKNFDGHIPHRIILENDTTNKCWRVKVEKDKDGSIYFGDGWYDYVDEHLLEVGDILVFERQEQSIFQVKIYGRSGCLKEVVKDKSEDHVFERTNEVEEEIEIDDDDKYENDISKNKCQDKTRSSKNKCREKIRSLTAKSYNHGVYKKKYAQDKTCVRTAKVSITEKSVGFSITLHRKKTYQFKQLTLPSVISKAKKLGSKDTMLLENMKGECWTVRVAHKRVGVDVFCYGWKEFVRDNKLTHGDTLNFEFITDDLLRVDVMRAPQVGNHFEVECQNEASGSPSLNGAFYEPVALTPNNELVEASTVEKVASPSLNNSFSIVWTNATIGDYLDIPKAVAESQNLKDKESVVLRDPEGKCWPLQVQTWSNGHTALSNGWSDFWKTQGITPGDSLNFEFRSEYLLQVTINRVKPLQNVIEEAESNPGVITKSIKIDPEEVDTIYHDANLSSKK